MANQTYTPGPGNAPYGNLPANPQAANYITDSGYGATGTILLQKAIRRAIFDAAPEQYNALKLVFEKGLEEYGSDEFEYLEKTFGRSALESTTAPVAVAAVPGAEVLQVIGLTAASLTHMSIDDVIVYPDGTKAIVRSVAGANVTVASQTGMGLPAVAIGDLFSVQAAIAGDGANTFSNYSRLQTITRYNYIQLFLRAARWSRIEHQKYINQGTTDYLDVDMGEKMKQLRTDLFVSFFNGTRGEFKLASTIPAKSMGGIYPSMQAAGSMSANPTTAALRSTFETLSFKTNFKKEGGVRMIYGTDEMLYELSKVFKDPGLRYAPNDTVANMNLFEYRLGTQRFVPVPCELFKEQSCFPASWQRKLLVLDQETITPVKMKGIPAMDSGSTLDKGDNGTREGFKDWFVEANLSLRFNNPLGSFSMDVQ
jgi:hypothetical protein